MPLTGMEAKLDSCFMQVPFDAVVQRMSGGKAVLITLMSLYQVKYAMLHALMLHI
jgi:hypothetical protein